MRNKLYYLFWCVFLFVSCEEYYHPSLDVTSGMLVVESHITNDISQNYVKLTLSQDFYARDVEKRASGAQVELREIGGVSLRGVESVVNSGYFTFAKTPVVGRSYFLKITYRNNVFCSDTVVMPPLPAIDTLYTGHKIVRKYVTNAWGNPDQVEIPSREIYADISTGSALKYYRFCWRAVEQWYYNPPVLLDEPPITWYGWTSVNDFGVFNLAGPKDFSTSQKINKYPLLSLAYDGASYLDSITLSPAGWIIILDQYGIQKESYDFHEALNKQFEAEGSLFDPVLTQVYGNIHCINDPNQIALGFFDLNSYAQHRYFFDFGKSEKGKVFLRRISNRYAISNRGYLINEVPIFWEYINTVSLKEID